jgi:hypothetical protein
LADVFILNGAPLQFDDELLSQFVLEQKIDTPSAHDYLSANQPKTFLD